MTNYKNEKEAKDAGLEVVAFDFDGVLAEYDDWKEGVIGYPIPEGINNLITKKVRGAYIVIFTTRLNSRLWGADAIALEEKRIITWLINQRCYQYVDLIVGDKPLADEYHDDRAIRFIREDLK